MLSFDLSGRTALVTGGFSGLGRHFAEVLAAHGAKVAIAGRRIELGREVAGEIAANTGREVRAYAMDVKDAGSVREAFEAAGRDMGVARIVVNNAGIVVRAPSAEMRDEDWREVVEVNLNGVFRTAQAAARALLAAKLGGSIVNVASILGVRVRAGVAPYTATKAAVVQLTQALALEWAEHGIRVNALAPGYFATEMNREMLKTPIGEALMSRVPQKRPGQLEELDGPLLLLASEASSYMTGAVIPVDGGHLVSTL